MTKYLKLITVIKSKKGGAKDVLVFHLFSRSIDTFGNLELLRCTKWYIIITNKIIKNGDGSGVFNYLFVPRA